MSGVRLSVAIIATWVLIVGSPAGLRAEEEIAYDDGGAEACSAWNDPDFGVGVRFTPSEYPTTVLRARIYVASSPFQNPLKVWVLDDDGPMGAPGTTLFGPVQFPFPHYEGWADFDFPPNTITVTAGDFYVAYLQVLAGQADVPCIGRDRSGPVDLRSWLVEYGQFWSQLPEEMGDVMIRAVVESGHTPVQSATWSQLKALLSGD